MIEEEYTRNGYDHTKTDFKPTHPIAPNYSEIHSTIEDLGPKLTTYKGEGGVIGRNTENPSLMDLGKRKKRRMCSE